MKAMSQMRVRGLIAVAVLAGVSARAGAGEHITLSNGFAMNCDHHAVQNDQVLLYLGAGEDNYIEFPSRDVARIEAAPDPPAAPHEPAQAAAVTAKPDVKLTPADLNEMLTRAGHEHNLDVDLLASVVKAESAGNAHALSPAGARGLMQLMPQTASGLGVEDSYQPEQNVRGGSAYLDALLVRYNDNMALALAAYNAGPAAVDRYHGIPPYHETRVYVARVIHEFNRRVQAREGQAHITQSHTGPAQRKSVQN
jgi:hypothetical protein